MKVVYDHFHIVKNFNDKVISEVRKDEQRGSLMKETQQLQMHLRKVSIYLPQREKLYLQKIKMQKKEK